MSSPLSQPSTPPADETFPECWLPYLRDNVFLYGLLPDAEQGRLRRLIPRFIAGKFWEGCAGLSLNDEIRVTIAAQACLLALGFDELCFENCRSILVYPGGFLHVAEDSFGIEINAGHQLGEAHHQGPVVLSWWHACWDGRQRGQGNVVIHEFAHKLTEQGDWQNGLPPLNDRRDAPRWETVFAEEYERLVEDAERERPTLLDPYGAKNRAEFFAVATECFFLQPAKLQYRHAQLYQLLAEWYRLDPAEWRSDEAANARTRAAEEQYLRHAVDECDAALRRDPHYLAAYWERAECFRALGDFAKACADYTRLLELVSRKARAEVYYERGRVHLEWEAFAEAIDDFTAAIRRYSDFAEAYRERGAAHVSRGEYAQALVDLRRALQLDPEDDLAYLERGCLWCATEKYDKAVRDLTRALRLCPYRAETYRRRADAYLRRQQYDRAFADCNEALRLDPNGVEAYRMRAAIHEAKGDRASAERDRAEADKREQ